ncbi:MAG: hypothetical protein COB02_05195 [Candidatus Cloacimonadota bacterium]|nr:MAG: hypothetical protein COB02_05195 [Candidatus Cloacimonadota bacterium]
MSDRRVDRSGPNPLIPECEKKVKDMEARGLNFENSFDYRLEYTSLRMMYASDLGREEFSANLRKLSEERNRKVAKDVKPK